VRRLIHLPTDPVRAVRGRCCDRDTFCGHRCGTGRHRAAEGYGCLNSLPVAADRCVRSKASQFWRSTAAHTRFERGGKGSIDGAWLTHCICMLRLGSAPGRPASSSATCEFGGAAKPVLCDAGKSEFSSMGSRGRRQRVACGYHRSREDFGRRRNLGMDLEPDSHRPTRHQFTF
jgi:hypothetical protein